MSKPLAIVLSSGYNALSMVQDLGRHGVPCVIMDSTRGIAGFSRYARFIKVPSPVDRETPFIKTLADYCHLFNQKPIVFPTNDEWAVALAKHYEFLSKTAVLSIGDWRGVSAVIDKATFYKLGVEKDYRTPKTWLPEEINTVEELNFPIVAKPRCRRTASDANADAEQLVRDRLRFVKLKNQLELTEFLAQEQPNLSLLLFQEFVDGLSDQMFTVGVYASHSHEILGIFTGRKIRGFPAAMGDCIVGENAVAPEHLLQLTQRIISDLRLSGIMEFEFKESQETGDYYLIEINPRSWSWVGITASCGPTLSTLAYSDLSGISLPQPPHFSGRVRYVKVLQDICNCLYRYRNDYPSWKKTPIQWVREMLAPDRLVCAEFRAFDLLPMLMSVILPLIKLTRSKS